MKHNTITRHDSIDIEKFVIDSILKEENINRDEVKNIEFYMVKDEKEFMEIMADEFHQFEKAGEFAFYVNWHEYMTDYFESESMEDIAIYGGPEIDGKETYVKIEY